MAKMKEKAKREPSPELQEIYRQTDIANAKRKALAMVRIGKFGAGYPETVIEELSAGLPEVIPDGLFEYSCQEVMKILQGKRYYTCIGGEGEDFQLQSVFSGKTVLPMERLMDLKVTLVSFNLDEFGNGNALMEVTEMETGRPSRVWEELAGDTDRAAKDAIQERVNEEKWRWDSWDKMYECWILAIYGLNYAELDEDLHSQDPWKSWGESLRDILREVKKDDEIDEIMNGKDEE